MRFRRSWSHCCLHLCRSHRSLNHYYCSNRPMTIHRRLLCRYHLNWNCHPTRLRQSWSHYCFHLCQCHQSLNRCYCSNHPTTSCYRRLSYR